MKNEINEFIDFMCFREWNDDISMRAGGRIALIITWLIIIFSIILHCWLFLHR